MHSEGWDRKVCAGQRQGQGRAKPVGSTWLRSSGESFRSLTEAAFWITCLASSALARVRSHRADSGRALQGRHGCDLGAGAGASQLLQCIRKPTPLAPCSAPGGG